MARNEEFEGKNLEEALNLAASELGMAEPDLDYEILEQGRPGLFGFGARNVRIRIIPPVEGSFPQPAPVAVRAPQPAPAPPAEPGPAEPSQHAESARSTLQHMLGLMGLEIEARVKSADGGLDLQLDGRDRELLSRKDGELLAALQFLLNRMSRRVWPKVGRIRLHCDGREETRDKDLLTMAREAGRQVGRTGRSKRLRQMNAYERRMIHMTIREMRGIGSRSEGDGHLKRVRIFKLKNRRG